MLALVCQDLYSLLHHLGYENILGLIIGKTQSLEAQSDTFSHLKTLWISLIHWPLRTSSKQYTHVAINICRPKIHAGGVNKWIYDSEKGKKCNTLENHVCSKIFCINITTNDLLHGMFLEWWNTNFCLNSHVIMLKKYARNLISKILQRAELAFISWR